MSFSPHFLPFFSLFRVFYYMLVHCTHSLYFFFFCLPRLPSLGRAFPAFLLLLFESFRCFYSDFFPSSFSSSSSSSSSHPSALKSLSGCGVEKVSLITHLLTPTFHLPASLLSASHAQPHKDAASSSPHTARDKTVRAVIPSLPPHLSLPAALQQCPEACTIATRRPKQEANKRGIQDANKRMFSLQFPCAGGRGCGAMRAPLMMLMRACGEQEGGITKSPAPQRP